MVRGEGTMKNFQSLVRQSLVFLFTWVVCISFIPVSYADSADKREQSSLSQSYEPIRDQWGNVIGYKQTDQRKADRAEELKRQADEKVQKEKDELEAYKKKIAAEKKAAADKAEDEKKRKAAADKAWKEAGEKVKEELAKKEAEKKKAVSPAPPVSTVASSAPAASAAPPSASPPLPVSPPLTPEEQARKTAMEDQALWDAYFGGFVDGLKKKAAEAADKVAAAKDPAEKAAAKAAAEKAERAAKGDRSSMSREDKERLEGLEEAYQKRLEQLQKEKAKKEKPLSVEPTISDEVAVMLPQIPYTESDDVRGPGNNWMNVQGDADETRRVLDVQIGQDRIVRPMDLAQGAVVQTPQTQPDNTQQTTPLCGPAPVLSKETPLFNFSPKPKAARHSGDWQWWKK